MKRMYRYLKSVGQQKAKSLQTNKYQTSDLHGLMTLLTVGLFGLMLWP